VHLHDPELLLLLPWLVRRRRSIVYDMHENLPASLEMKKWIPLLLQRPMRWAVSIVERVAFLSAKVIFAEASYAQHYAWVKSGTIVRNLPQVDALPLRRNVVSDRVILCYVGAISRERGGIEMLEATRLLRENGVDVSLAMAGPASREFLDNMIRVIGDDLRPFVQYLGKVPITDAWEVVAESTIGLAMLHPHANYVESLPTKVLEYMGIGVPVIASDFPLYREVVEGNSAGICVAPERADLLAQAVLGLLVDRDEMRAMGERGRLAARTKFDWSIDRARLIGLYETMC
jgi:glycosyltransferase involved in cell wall biosynthesis